jgi:circadian clock protein KaiB
MNPEPTDDKAGFENALDDSAESIYFFRLYVTGTTPRSVRAIQNLREMCDAHLLGRYQVEVIDIYQQPGEAQSNQIIVTPTLIKSLPVPPCRIIGDLSHVDRVLISLDIVSAPDKERVFPLPE